MTTSGFCETAMACGKNKATYGFWKMAMTLNDDQYLIFQFKAVKSVRKTSLFYLVL
jgi:hypothetical protein